MYHFLHRILSSLTLSHELSVFGHLFNFNNSFCQQKIMHISSSFCRSCQVPSQFSFNLFLSTLIFSLSSLLAKYTDASDVCLIVDERCEEEVTDTWLTVQEIAGAADEDSRRLSAVLCTLCQAERVQTAAG